MNDECAMYHVLLFKPFFFSFSFVEIMKLASEEASAAYDLPVQNGIPDLQSLISPQVRALPPPPNVVGAVAAPEVQEMPVVPVGLPSVLPSAMGVLPSPRASSRASSCQPSSSSATRGRKSPTSTTCGNCACAARACCERGKSCDCLSLVTVCLLWLFVFVLSLYLCLPKA